MEKLYNNIKVYRKSKGLKQYELAELVGYSDRSVISKIENGQIDLPLPMVEKFAKALGVSSAELMGWDDEILDPSNELVEYLEELKTRPELRMLFSLTKNATKEDVEQAVKIIEAIRK